MAWPGLETARNIRHWAGTLGNATLAIAGIPFVIHLMQRTNWGPNDDVAAILALGGGATMLMLIYQQHRRTRATPRTTKETQSKETQPEETKTTKPPTQTRTDKAKPPADWPKDWPTDVPSPHDARGRAETLTAHWASQY